MQRPAASNVFCWTQGLLLWHILFQLIRKIRDREKKLDMEMEKNKITRRKKERRM